MPVYDHESDPAMDTAAFQAFTDAEEIHEPAFATRMLMGALVLAALLWTGIYGLYLLVRAVVGG